MARIYHGWAYVSGSRAEAQGPMGAVQYHKGDTVQTGSANFIYVTGSDSLLFTGSLHVSGTITANDYDVINKTITYLSSSGDSKFGDSTNDTHQFTGSVSIESGDSTSYTGLRLAGTSNGELARFINTNNTAIVVVDGATGYDARINFQEASAVRWEVGNDETAGDFRIRDQNYATRFTITQDPTTIAMSGDVGIGSSFVGAGRALPSGALHVQIGEGAGVAPSSLADDLVLASDDALGMSLLSPAADTQSIYFGSPGDTAHSEWISGQSLGYTLFGTSHADHKLYLRSGNAVPALTLDEFQNVTGAVEIKALGGFVGDGSQLTNLPIGNQGIFTPISATHAYTTSSVGIGTTGPDRKLDVLDASNPQLRLTHTDGTKFVDMQVDTYHNLTVVPSSTGHIRFTPTTDSTDFFHVQDNSDNIVLSVDTTNQRVGIGPYSPTAVLDISGSAGGNTLRIGESSAADTIFAIDARSGMDSRISFLEDSVEKWSIRNDEGDQYLRIRNVLHGVDQAAFTQGTPDGGGTPNTVTHPQGSDIYSVSSGGVNGSTLRLTSTSSVNTSGRATQLCLSQHGTSKNRYATISALGENTSTHETSMTFQLRGASAESEVLRLTSAGQMWLGTQEGPWQFTLNSDSNNALMALRQNDNTAAQGPRTYYNRARGTEAAPFAVQDDDVLGSMFFFGWDGTNWENAAIIKCEVDAFPATGSTDMPGRLVFMTSPDNDDDPVERMRITNAGEVGIGTVAPAQPLHLMHSSPAFRISDQDSTSIDTATPYIDFYDRATTARAGYFGCASSTNQNMTWMNSSPTGSNNICTADSSTKIAEFTYDNKVLFPQLQNITANYYMRYNTTSGEISYLTSTRNVKENIQDLSLDYNSFMALRPRSFDYREAAGGTHHWGFIAEENAAASPNLSNYGPDWQYDEKGAIVRSPPPDLDPGDDPGLAENPGDLRLKNSEDAVPCDIDDRAIIAALVKVVQDMHLRIQELEGAS